jgi:polar amino acid transport system substrate-binding protein
MKTILLLLIYCAAFPSHSYIKTEIIYYKSHNPPFQFDNNEHEIGFITNIIQSLPNVGITFKPKALSFNRMIKEMSTSKEHWISYGSNLWVGAQSTSLSEITVWKVKHVFFTLKSNKFDGIQSLFDQTLVLIDGFDYPGLDSYINKGLIQKVIRVKTPELAILSVLEGDADVYPDMLNRVQYFLNKMETNKKGAILHDKDNIIPEYEIKLCFSKHFPPLLKADIEIKLRNMKRLNEFENIMSNLIE